MCNKHFYPSKREAYEALSFFRRHQYNKLGQRLNRGKGHKDKRLKRIYYCDFCTGWHTTSTNQIDFKFDMKIT